MISYIIVDYVSVKDPECCVSCVVESEPLKRLDVSVVPLFLFALICNHEWLEEHLTSAALPGEERWLSGLERNPKKKLTLSRVLCYVLTTHSPSERNPPRH